MSALPSLDLLVICPSCQAKLGSMGCQGPGILAQGFIDQVAEPIASRFIATNM
jgi:hypothetical protein